MKSPGRGHGLIRPGRPSPREGGVVTGFFDLVTKNVKGKVLAQIGVEERRFFARERVPAGDQTRKLESDNFNN